MPCPRNRPSRSKDESTRSREKGPPQFRRERTSSTARPTAWPPREAFAPPAPRPKSKKLDALAIEGRPEIRAANRHHSAVWKMKRPAKSSVISSPAAPSALPTSRFPSRKEIASAAPDGETPRAPNPLRPRSCTVVSIPGARTSITLTRSPAPRIARGKSL